MTSKVDYAIKQLTVHRRAQGPASAGHHHDHRQQRWPAATPPMPVARSSRCAPSCSPRSRPYTWPKVDTDDLITPDLTQAVARPAASGRSRCATADVNGKDHRNTWCTGTPVPTSFGHVELYYMVPLTTEDSAANEIRTTVLVTGLALVILLGVVAALVTRLVVTPGPGRRPHRAAALGRPARPADGGRRRGRPGPAGRLVQPDGGQPAAADRPAGGDVPPAAPVHLRRVARAADAADHGADGRRPALRRARRVRPGGGAQRRAAAGRAGPVREPAHRPAGDQPVRRRVRRAGRRAHRPRADRAAGRRAARRPGRAGRGDHRAAAAGRRR